MISVTLTLLVLCVTTLINGTPVSNGNGNPVEEEALTRAVISCSIWYWTQPDPAPLLAKTVKPPCTIPSSFPSTLTGGWTVDPGCDASKQPNTCDFHLGAYGCYRNALSTTGPGAQACYDKNGQWISNPWKGAGTLDVETPLGDAAQQLKHFAADVAPYYSCCRLALFLEYNCNHYYEKRPPGQCQN